MDRRVKTEETEAALEQSVGSLIELALKEDLPGEDVTTEAVGVAGRAAEAVIVAEEEMVVSGLKVARRVFETLDPEVRWQQILNDGDRARSGSTLARVRGRAGSLLAAERTALNFLQRLSGVATLTARFVARIADSEIAVMDTRKTTPGWRFLEKEAVRHGGGTNHRFSLSDAILIKDNHVRLAGGVGAAVRKAKESSYRNLKVEVEAGNLREVSEALGAGADRILVDNTTPDDLKLALEAAEGKAEVEVSGGITERNVEDMAATGVKMISIGALTHSARAVDISIDIVPAESVST
jgi:nicotinate-nucleotide pyrophosphorylase (carboxylating)